MVLPVLSPTENNILIVVFAPRVHVLDGLHQRFRLWVIRLNEQKVIDINTNCSKGSRLPEEHEDALVEWMLNRSKLQVCGNLAEPGLGGGPESIN